MKIIALLPIKNESWVLGACLESLSLIADEIVILDDNLNDNYEDILLKFSKVIILKGEIDNSQTVNMSAKRRTLLDIGRRRGGTHFIWLDADEIFSDIFFCKYREYLAKMVPGQKIMMKWLFLLDNESYRSDGIFSEIYKDFIFFDDGDSGFEDKKLSESRTPGGNTDPIIVRPEEGVVLHLQYINKDRNNYKQAWYRCSELIEGKRSARRINNTYAITVNSHKWKRSDLPVNFKSKFVDYVDLRLSDDDWYIKEIIKFFNEYGIGLFEPLQIWDIEELHEEFVKRVGRNPVSKTFPSWIIFLNDLKNRLVNKINF